MTKRKKAAVDAELTADEKRADSAGCYAVAIEAKREMLERKAALEAIEAAAA